MTSVDVDGVLQRIDDELAANQAERDAHPGDPSIALLVEVGKLPPAALEWTRKR